MVRLLTFFLSAGLIILSACESNPDDWANTAELSSRQRQKAIKYWEAQSGRTYQGSAYRQEAFDRLLALDPDNELYYRGKSITHSKIGDYHRAIPLLEKSKALDPRSSLYYYAWLLVDLYQDYERGLAYLEEYDQLTPDQKDYAWGVNVFHLKGICHKELGNYSQAVEAFTQAIESEGEHPDVYSFVYRGNANAAQKKFDLAILDYQQALDRYPECSMALFYRAKAEWEGFQNHEAALINLDRTRELLEKGYKLTDPYHEVVDEIHLEMVEDLEKQIRANI